MDYPHDFDKIVLYDKNSTFETLYTQLKNITYNNVSDYVTEVQVSEFIENLLLQLPVHSVVLVETKPRDKFTAIHSDRLLTMLKIFCDGEMRIIGLKLLKKLNGLTYNEMDFDTQTRLDNSAIHTICYKNGNDKFLELLKERAE